MISPAQDELIDLYFEKRLDDEGAGQMLSKLKSSKEFQDRFFEQFDIHYLLRYSSLVEEYSLPGTSSNTTHSDCPSEEQLRKLLLRHDQSRELRKNETSAEALLLDDSLARQLHQLRFVDSLVTQIDPTETLPSTDVGPEPIVSKSGNVRSKSSPDQRLSIFTKIMILLVLLLYLPLVYREFNPPEADSSRTKTIRLPAATITDMADVHWMNETDNSYTLGQPLYSNRLQFTKGTIELLFFNGVQCVVEGPADIVLMDEKQVLCRQGSWSVTVPKQGQGFEIQTPRNVIRDLGTIFHAEIDHEDIRVQVLKGLVELEEPGRETLQIRDRQAIVSRRDGTKEPFSFQIDRFIPKSEMRRRSDLSLQFDRFFQKTIKNPKDPIYRFDLNQVRSQSGVVGGKIVEGRTPKSKAFRFAEATDRVRLTTTGQTESLSAIVWLRLDKLLFGHNPVLMSKGMERDGLVWQISERGTIILGWRQRRNQSLETKFESPVVFTDEMLGKWVQLAFVVDGSQRHISLYMDGQPILCDMVSQKPNLSLAHLDLGNWQSTQKGESAFKPLEGAVAELLLFNISLTPYDIRAAYDAAVNNAE